MYNAFAVILTLLSRWLRNLLSFQSITQLSTYWWRYRMQLTTHLEKQFMTQDDKDDGIKDLRGNTI